MKLKLCENIRKLRKEKGLTQEKLAEILAVSVGAVSKWENGNNTPDIETLAILADFFDISIDALLGYDLSSKKIKDIIEDINSKVGQHMFDEAEAASRDALSRYPHDFPLIYTSACMYQLKALEKEDIKAAKRSIELFENARDHLSQNDNPEINEFTINLSIASSYSFFDEKKAIEIFKENNFAGISDAIMSFTYLKMGETDESLKCSTNGIIRNVYLYDNRSDGQGKQKKHRFGTSTVPELTRAHKDVQNKRIRISFKIRGPLYGHKGLYSCAHG